MSNPPHDNACHDPHHQHCQHDHDHDHTHEHVHGEHCDHNHDHDPDHAHLEHPGTFMREGPKVGRNDPCPCHSGKKFKKCCGM